MKKFINYFLLPFIGFLLFAGVVAMGVEMQTGINPYTTIAVMAIAAFFLSAIKTSKNTYPKGALRNGVEVEIWANYIIERLWKDNQFLKYMFSDDDKVLAGKIVHIPQPGQKPKVVKNRNVFPATAIRRTDTDIIYALDEYTTDPTHIQDAEKVELSYDKIDSVYGDHAAQLIEDVAGDAIVRYLMGIPQASIIKTTGASTSDEIPDGATGSRKVLTVADFKKAQTKMNKQNILKTDRYALLTANHLSQLQDDLSITEKRDFSQYQDVENGVVGRLYGFNIMDRSDVAIAQFVNDEGLIKPYGAEGEEDDCEVSFFWQKNAVARALGEVKFFENPDRAEYYGDVYSALLRFGGRRRREDNFGVIALVQDKE